MTCTHLKKIHEYGGDFCNFISMKIRTLIHEDIGKNTKLNGEVRAFHIMEAGEHQNCVVNENGQIR
jgi:hypothetical protein